MATPTSFSEEALEERALPVQQEWLNKFRSALKRDPRLWLGGILLVFALAALLAPVISPYSPDTPNPIIGSQAPSLAHPLGTDALGRDQLSRVIYGTRISLSVGLVSIVIGGLLGTFLGMIAAYAKGWVDQIISMIVDTLLAFPGLILALAIIAALGPSINNVVIALAIVRIPLYTRLARGQTLQVAEQDYVTAAQVNGTRTWKIIFRHILPNIFSPLLVQATISISYAILDESVLSFLGLGAQPPTPEWGTMINDAQPYLRIDPWMMMGPALAIILVVLSLNLFGDAVRDLLDPRDQARIAGIARERGE
ncbi:MAG: ABC transporter permease [Ktedonobacteraceae bacterium]|nr:ABC transporter permease [Ktedonobacteraceae bacterium]MBO0791412.1 ABC transporter permease [Ktedonobacteraceae bacterium]